MKKTLSLLVMLGLVAGVTLLPGLAEAKKKKTIEESFAAQGAPYPVLGDVDPNGCLGGTEGVHKVSHSFETPKKGLLEVNMHSFEGDWDLFVTDGAGSVIASSTAGQPIDPPGETIVTALGAKTEYLIVACNWAGAPLATVDYVFTY